MGIYARVRAKRRKCKEIRGFKEGGVAGAARGAGGGGVSGGPSKIAQPFMAGFVAHPPAQSPEGDDRVFRP